MSEAPLRSFSVPLCASLVSLLFALASPAFANEPSAELAAAASGLALEPTPDEAPDLSAVEHLERRVDRELTTDVGRMLDAIVADRTAEQMHWLERHYFDAAAGRSRVPPGAAPLAQTPPANQR